MRFLRNLFRRPKVGRNEALAAILPMVEEWEGFRDRAYLCPAGVLTIGYGTTNACQSGFRFEKGARISKAKARQLLRSDLEEGMAVAERLLGTRGRPWVAAGMASLIYNVGASAVARSRFLIAMKARDHENAKTEFLDFCRSGGAVLRGLVSRRRGEWEVIERDWK